MGQECPAQPAIPSQDIQQLRFGLIDEENKELADAAAADDLVEVADALCDTLYVVLGACLAYGFSPELMEKLFAEVQASNMSKACSTLQEALDTRTWLCQQGSNRLDDFLISQVGDKWVVKRKSDGKVLKSMNWKQPNLKAILDGSN